MINRVGQQLGNYRLTHLIGTGGFAEVYLAEHIFLKSQAAIKVLFARLPQEDMTRFLREAQFIANLHHPHIVRILDFGVESQKNSPFLVMDFAPNGTLRQRHQSGSQLPTMLILSYVRQIASALQYAHDHRLIHRDIKPENLLLGPNNEILLSDFGTALIGQTASYQTTQETAGTVAYMAPEQLQGKPRFASDQYALGVVVYEWLCGARPFQGSFTEVASQHILALPPPLREKIPWLNPAVETVVLSALSKDPQERFSSVSAFAQALERACMATPILPPDSYVREQPISIPLPPPSMEISTLPTPAVLPNSGYTHQSEIESMLTAHPPTPIPSSAPTPKRISRRGVLIGTGAGLIALVAIGGAAWWEFFRTPPIGTTLHSFLGHANSVSDVAWSLPDGQYLATASYDNTVKVWSIQANQLTLTYKGFPAGAAVNCVAWSPDGLSIIAGGGDHKVHVWDIAGNTLYTYSGHTTDVFAAVWSPNSQYIASADGSGKIYVWHANTGENIVTYRGHTNQVNSLVWAPDGQRIVSGDQDGKVLIWNAFTGQTLRTYTGHIVSNLPPGDQRSSNVRSVDWSPDGKYIASAGYDFTVQVWVANTGETVSTYKGHVANGVNVIPNVDTAVWSPDGQRIASGGGDRTVQIWDAFTGNHVYTYTNHRGYVYTAAWSPHDGHYIASGDSVGEAYIWQAR